MATVSLMLGPDHPVPVQPQGGTATVAVDQTGGTVYYAESPSVSIAAAEGSIAPGGSQTFTTPVWLIASALAGVQVTVTSVYDQWVPVSVPGITAASITVPSVAVFGSSYATEQGTTGTQGPGAPRRGFGSAQRLSSSLGTARLFNPAQGGGNAVLPTWNTLQASTGTASYPYRQGIAGQILQNIQVGGPGGSWPAASPVPAPPYDFYMSGDCPGAVNAFVWGINEPAAFGSTYMNAHIWAMRYAAEALIAGAVGAHNDAGVAYSGGSNVLDTLKGLGPGYRLLTTSDNNGTITITGGPFTASWPGGSDVSLMFLARTDAIASVSVTVDGQPVNILQKGVSAAAQNIVGGGNASPNSVQFLQVNATGGTWTPAIGGVNGTSVAFNATPAQVQTSLRSIAGYGSVVVGAPTNVLWGTQNYTPAQAYRVFMKGATLPAPNITIGTNALTGNGATVVISDNQWGYQFVTIPASALPAGAHTIVCKTVIGAGQIGFNGYTIRAINPPTVLLPNINRIPQSGYNIYTIAGYPFTINDALVAQYNAAMVPNGSPFTNEWNTINGKTASAVRFVDLDAAIGANPAMFSSDGLHTNNTGQAELTKAYLRAIPGVSQPQISRVNSAVGIDAAWQTPVYQNSWAGTSSGPILFVTNSQALRFRKDPQTNLVHLQGACVRTGAPANLETMFAIPAGYLPENPIIVAVRTDTGVSTCGVQPVQGIVSWLNPTGFAAPTSATGYVWFDAWWYAAA